MWHSFWAYIRNLTMGGSKESSKRFIALYVGVVLISYIVFRFAKFSNVEMILGELIAFVITLLGLAVREKKNELVHKPKDCPPKDEEPEI